MPLRELRSGVKTITVWLDQICINQGDEDEKEQQVKLMARIYSQARQVIGWLGESTPPFSLALKAFQALGLSTISYSIERHRKRQNITEIAESNGQAKYTGHLIYGGCKS